MGNQKQNRIADVKATIKSNSRVIDVETMVTGSTSNV